MQIDEPIFRSVQQALHFSFLIETIPVSQKSQMQEIYQQGKQRTWQEDKREPTTIRFGGLSPLEVRGQCAMVRGAVMDHLLIGERHAVHARYALQNVQSSGVRAMRDEAMPMLSCQDEWPTLAMAWLIFGSIGQTAGITTRSIADEFELSQNMVMRDIGKIRRAHHALELMAFNKLSELFRKDRLIGD